MKIQELAIIFIIIILPISLLLSEYTQFQIQTISMQTEYDAKLTSATYDAIKAFQLNTINSSTSNSIFSNSQMGDLEASINSFRNSIKTAFELNGYTDEELNNYIPALVYTLYDGFYIYSPYENIVNDNGDIIENANQHESLYGIKPYINYSCRYQKGNMDVVITYALDNHVTVQGMIGNKYVNKSGYLIDNISIIGDSVWYNGVEIEEEQLKENLAGRLCSYVKENDTKYYLIENYINKDGVQKNAIVSTLNGVITLQGIEGSDEYNRLKRLIEHNDYAQKYYKEAEEFTEWFKNTGLATLTYADAVDEVIDKETEEVSKQKIWPVDNRKIFDFNLAGDPKDNIENELSNFNQHRLAVIRHKIETNLAIAISNYNNYSGVDNVYVFQMPELKENEWEYITHNISMISFLQGLHIGGKIYNGYSLVTNSESKEVVLEQNIYVLGTNENGQKNYCRIGEKGFEDNSVKVDATVYGDVKSAGRLNLDFKRATLTNNDGIATYYYYPLNEYNASYNSIVMQNNVTTYDDIYQYVNECDNADLKKAFYTALGRERYSIVKKEEKEYKVLIAGTISNDRYEESYRNYVINIANQLNNQNGIEATYVYDLNKETLKNFVKEQKNNYDLIVIASFAWPMGIERDILHEISNNTNIITISNDEYTLPMMENGITLDSVTTTPIITDAGKNKLGDILISGSTDTQARFKFISGVEVFYTGNYSDGYTGDLIGCWKNKEHKWIHSQVAFAPNNDNHMKLLKELVYYALSK